VTCDDVRTLLPEHAVGSLDVEQDAEVRRHLRGCAACRGEASALEEGVGVFAATLVRPAPTELHDRVRTVLAEEWAEGRPAPGAGRRRAPLLAAAAVAAVLAATAVAVVQTGRAEDLATDAAGYRTVLATLGGTGFRVGSLEPAGSTPVEGSVVAYESSHDQSFVVVFVRTPEIAGEGRLVASRSDGTSWNAGPIEFDGDGDADTWWVTDRTITTMTGLRVLAPDGSLLATASLRDA
jgi:putative zinc finger protein